MPMQGLTQSLAAPGISTPNYNYVTGKAFSTTARDLESIVGIMGSYGKVLKNRDAKKKSDDLLLRGQGTQQAKEDAAYWNTIFEAGPTDQTVGAFPKLELGDRDGLNQHIAGLIASRMPDDPSAQQAYAEYLAPKLMEYAGGYVVDRAHARENVRINMLTSSLSTPSQQELMLQLSKGREALQFQYEAVDFTDKVIIPAIKTAIEMGHNERASQLLNWALLSDPTKTSELRSTINSALLPGLQNLLSTTLGMAPQKSSTIVNGNTVTTTGPPATLDPIIGIYNNAGGISNSGAVSAVVAGVRGHITTGAGLIVEERLKDITRVQLAMSEYADPLWNALSRLHQDAQTSLIAQRNTLVAQRSMTRAENTYQATNKSLDVIQNKGDEAAHLIYLRTTYGADKEGERYVRDYYKMKDQFAKDTQGTGGMVESNSVVIQLTDLAEQSWTPYSAAMVREQASNALTNGDITIARYLSIVRSIDEKEVTTIANTRPGLTDFERSLEEILLVGAGAKYEELASGMIGNIKMEIQGLGVEVVQELYMAKSILKTEFREEWLAWHREETTKTLLRGDRDTYDIAAAEKLRELYSLFTTGTYTDKNGVVTTQENNAKKIAADLMADWDARSKTASKISVKQGQAP